MKIAFLCLLPFLGGCNKILNITLLNPLSVSGTGAHNQTVLVIGQSNNVRFEQYGEQAFTQDYHKRFPSASVTFINCAVGGTGISQWLIDGPLMAQCQIGNLKPTVILFYQGEADAYAGSQTWAQQFTQAVNGWRRSFGNVPVIYAQLAVEDPALYCPLSQWQSLQQQQASVFLPHVTMIRTSDISALDPDTAIAQGVHLSQASYINIADRYVQALGE